MRFLFRELFKRLRIRYIILILVLSIPISYVFQYVVNVTLISKNEFPLEKSPNPQATEHFIKAMEYRNYISHIHNFIDYDNFLMRPLFNKMNEEYEKGKSLLPKTSAEDVYWYVILYRGIYGIGGIPDDYDMSMAYKTTLTKEDYKKHYEDIVNKIKRFAINDFNYDVPRVTEYKFEFMDDLLSELFFSAIGKLENFEEEMYDGFYAITTNLEDDNVNEIIKVSERRWQIEECFRIMKSEFKARPAHVSTDTRIQGHFLTCYLALVLYRYLEKRTGNKTGQTSS